MKAAEAHGKLLPSFKDTGEAERILLGRRDELLNVLRQAATKTEVFTFDFTPKSLKSLEHWYFQTLDAGNFEFFGLDREMLERCIHMYLAEVIVRNHPEWKWTVTEYAFEPGKYEIGIERPLYRVNLGRADLAIRPNNKRKQSLWREYQGYVA
jgi:phenylpropionate dioxygenase-like ring-hydroxylating dioxygenase large terminal subunit